MGQAGELDVLRAGDLGHLVGHDQRVRVGPEADEARAGPGELRLEARDDGGVGAQLVDLGAGGVAGDLGAAVRGAEGDQRGDPAGHLDVIEGEPRDHAAAGVGHDVDLGVVVQLVHVDHGLDEAVQPAGLRLGRLRDGQADGVVAAPPVAAEPQRHGAEVAAVAREAVHEDDGAVPVVRQGRDLDAAAADGRQGHDRQAGELPAHVGVDGLDGGGDGRAHGAGGAGEARAEAGPEGRGGLGDDGGQGHGNSD